MDRKWCVGLIELLKSLDPTFEADMKIAAAQRAEMLRRLGPAGPALQVVSSGAPEPPGAAT